jgi:hypothetical protein
MRDTTGGRASLKFDLNDNWSITPQIMAQEQKTNGTFGYDRTLGDLKVAHKYPENSKDRWYQAALTVEGKIANLDITYAGGYLERKVDTNSDYSDYSYWYDVAYYAAHNADPENVGLFGTYFYDNAGDYIDFSQYIQGKDRYRRETHELRIATPAENRLRFVGGVFAQRQVHDIEQRYLINGLADDLSVTGWPNTIWLTEQERIDRDKAIFGELTFDITDKLTATGGIRWFEAENSLQGYFGFATVSAAAARAARRCAASSRATRAATPRTGAVREPHRHRTLQEPRPARRREGPDRQGESGVQVHRRPDGVRDLLEGLPSGRHQSRRQPCRRISRTS